MKRISKVLTVVMLIALSLFVSCDNGMQVSDGTASVRFASGTEDGNARSLSRVNPVFKADDLYWMYTAKKVDNSGLSTGEVSTPTTVGTDGKLTSSVGPFSLGDWEFTLYAYTDSAFENLAYKGSTTARLVKSDSGNSVSVTVSAMKTSEGKGYIAFPAKGGISLTDSNGNPVTNYNEFITITNIENSVIAVDGVENSEERVFEVASGAYKVTVAYCDVDDNTLKYGENSIYVNVWDNLTTTIGGSLDEITSDTTFKPSDGTVEASVTATISDSGATIEVASSPANLDSTDSTEKTTVEIPAGATDAGSATLTVKPYTVEKVGDFIIEADEGRTVVGGLDLKLEVEGQTIDTFSSAVTVTTYIAKGLNEEELEIKYNGTGDDPTLESYDSTSGKLVFTTTHFSEFYVTSSSVAYILETNTAYYSLEEAIDAANNDQTVVLINDIAISNESSILQISENKRVSLHGNNDSQYTNIKGSFDLLKGASLVLQNIYLTTDKENDLILSSTGGIEIGIYNSKLMTYENCKAIDININENPDCPVEISIENSSFYMKAAEGGPTYGASCGINLCGDSTQKHNYEDQLDKANIRITNSNFKDISEGNYSIIPISFYWVDEVDLIMDNVDIEINKNHYAIRFYGVGRDDTESNISITNSKLKAWSSYYIQADSRNIIGEIKNSILTGVNENSGPSDGFSTVSIDSSSGCILDIDNSEIVFNKNGTASQSAISIYYYDHTGMEGGNIVKLTDCSISFNGELENELPIITSSADSIMTRSGSPINGYNYIIFDEETKNNLLEKGYVIQEVTEKLAIDPSWGDDITGIDEDGYTKIPYDAYNFFYPAFSDEGRIPDNEPYQFEQTVIELSPKSIE